MVRRGIPYAEAAPVPKLKHRSWEETVLTKWTLTNFKPIKGNLSLDLAPVNILVGANSSGKSSIIQSILLMKQTLQYGPQQRPIVLNGPLLKLGQFEDVKNSKSSEQTFGFAWTYDGGAFPGLIESPEDQSVSSSLVRKWELREIRVETVYSKDTALPDKQLASLQPILVSGALRASPGQNEQEAYLLYRRNANPDTSGDAVFPFTIESSDEYTRIKSLEDHPGGNMVGAFLRHFLPVYIAVAFDSSKRLAVSVADVITNSTRILPRRQQYNEMKSSPELNEILAIWINANAEVLTGGDPRRSLPDMRALGTIGEISEEIRRLSLRLRATGGGASFPSMEEIRPDIIDAVYRQLEPSHDVELEQPRYISEAASHIRRYFEERVQYLGPLRDEPRPLYPLEATGSLASVGYRGEHTAAVLHLFRDKRVRHLPPDMLGALERGEAMIEKIVYASLSDALSSWLSYIGVAIDVHSDDLGKIGHKLQVKTTSTGSMLDLTNVGVGVSQVMPIVVMALLAPAGSVLIFEQPELHLHPKVQSRLADFFLAMALSGRQCIVETHSEYMINRMRRRIAEAKDPGVNRLCRLFFVEQSSEGDTRCRPVNISRFGALEEWPDGFFDQTQEEAETIIMAASRKRVSERGKT